MSNLMNIIHAAELEGIDIWAGASVPEGINKDLCISYIIKRNGLLTPVYAEPLVLQMSIQMWFTSNQWTFEHLLNIINAEYSPIENVYEQRNETTVRDFDEGHEDNRIIDEGNESSTTHGHMINNTGTNTEQGQNEHTVAAFNTSEYSADNKDVNGSTATTSNAETHSGTDLETSSTDRSEDLSGSRTEDETTTYEVFRHGNIGVTTNQQMINEELDLLERFNMYEWIAAKFEKDIMLSVY